MNADRIKEMAAATLSGGLPFPVIVGNLMDEGVEYYHVDYVRLSFTFYSANGGVVAAPLVLEGLPAVAENVDLAALRLAIVDSQLHGQKYPEFCRRAMMAGVQSYFVYLRGRRALYLGRQGDQHTEWFPGAGRDDG